MTAPYHLATLTAALGTVPDVLAGVERWCAAAPGTLLGCWTTELGQLNQVLVLQGFADAAASDAERQRAVMAEDPFCAARHLTAMSVDRMAAFPGLPAVRPGAPGPVYEVRTYTLRPGGLPAVLARWGEMLPGRHAVSPLLIAMHALDGAPRIVHIWPYPDLAARAEIRAKVVAQGLWPPPTAPQISTMATAIAVPALFSPLQ